MEKYWTGGKRPADQTQAERARTIGKGNSRQRYEWLRDKQKSGAALSDAQKAKLRRLGNQYGANTIGGAATRPVTSPGAAAPRARNRVGAQAGGVANTPGVAGGPAQGKPVAGGVPGGPVAGGTPQLSATAPSRPPKQLSPDEAGYPTRPPQIEPAGVPDPAFTPGAQLASPPSPPIYQPQTPGPQAPPQQQDSRPPWMPPGVPNNPLTQFQMASQGGLTPTQMYQYAMGLRRPPEPEPQPAPEPPAQPQPPQFGGMPGQMAAPEPRPPGPQMTTGGPLQGVPAQAPPAPWGGTAGGMNTAGAVPMAPAKPIPGLPTGIGMADGPYMARPPMPPGMTWPGYPRAKL